MHMQILQYDVDVHCEVSCLITWDPLFEMHNALNIYSMDELLRHFKLSHQQLYLWLKLGSIYRVSQKKTKTIEITYC